MNELEMSLTLGLIVEPEKNMVNLDPLGQTEMHFLRHIFAISKAQSQEIGRFNHALWADLLPWHSMN